MSERQVQGMSILLSLQHEVRKLTTVRDFGFFVTNETFRLISYNHAVLWNKKPAVGITLESISGVANVDKTTPFNQWLSTLIKSCDDSNLSEEQHAVDFNESTYELQKDWPQEAGQHVLWCPFVQGGFDRDAGMVFIRDRPWSEPEANRLSWLIQSYAYTWYFLTQSRGFLKAFKSIFKHRRSFALTVCVIALIIIFFPIRQSVVAAAEVIAQSPTLVTAPLEGVIKEIDIKPNQKVVKGQILFKMDDTDLENNYKLAQQELAVAREQYQRSVQKGFDDAESRAEVGILKATVREKLTHMHYTKALLEKTIVRAHNDGVIIFGSKNDWVGKPVATGEKVMELAHPKNVELEIWLPVGDAIQFEVGSDVKLYLSGSPLDPLDAKLAHASFDAVLSPASVLAYRLIADFTQNEKLPRIGLQGSAKIYGDRTVLIYFLLRRPISALRQTVGW